MTALLATLWMPDAVDLRLLAPDFVLLGTIVAILLAPVVSKRSTYATTMLAILGCILCALAALLNINPLSAGGVELFGPTLPDGSTAPGMLLADPLSAYFRVFLMIFLAAVIAMWMMFDAERERHATEFFTLLLSSALGMSLMVSTTNLLMMIVAIEMASLPSYALAGFDKSRRISAEASVKYVVFGAATSGFMIYGASLLYGLFGTLHVPTLLARLAEQDTIGLLVPIALLALFAGIAFKISAVPFHFWCPDVFEGASLPVATWLSVASKAAGLVLFLRLVFSAAGLIEVRSFVENVAPIIQYGVGFFAILTCTFANFAAYRQTNIRRMLAYSSICHAGYMLMAGAIVVRLDGYANAVSAVVAYLLIYMFMNLGAFMSLGLVASDRGNENLTAFSGLGYRDPITAGALTVCLISLVGLPPFGGFIVKWWLMASLSAAAGSSGESAYSAPFMWVLVTTVALNTAVSLYYYARVVWQMYFVPADEQPMNAPGFGRATVFACAVVLLLTGTIWVGPLKQRTDAFTAGMFTGIKVDRSAGVIGGRSAALIDVHRGDSLVRGTDDPSLRGVSNKPSAPADSLSPTEVSRAHE